LRYSNLHSALFILLVLHHLRPTPLPYTTLFRSHQDRPRLRAGPARRPRERGDRPGDHDDGRETRPAGDGRGGRDGGGTARTALARLRPGPGCADLGAAAVRPAQGIPRGTADTAPDTPGARLAPERRLHTVGDTPRQP